MVTQIGCKGRHHGLVVNASCFPSHRYNLPWRQDTFRSSAGEAVPGFLAPLPSEEGAESVHAVSWVKDGLSHNYRVRVRPGWCQLKSCLVQVSCAGGLAEECFHLHLMSLPGTCKELPFIAMTTTPTSLHSSVVVCCVQGREKFHTTVCSLGRTVYVQAVCNLLDPDNEIIPRTDYPERVVSGWCPL